MVLNKPAEIIIDKLRKEMMEYVCLFGLDKEPDKEILERWTEMIAKAEEEEILDMNEKW